MWSHLFFMLACNTEPTTSTPAKQQTEATKPVTKKKKSSFVSPKTLNMEKAAQLALAPSPEKSRQAVEKAGITTTLSSLIPKREYSLDGIDADHAAIRVGIILSDTILGVKELSKDQLVNNLAFIHKGLQKMKAGKGLLSTIQDFHQQSKEDKLSREDLLHGLERIVSMSVPEEGFGKDDRSGPLLQAGAWVAGINLTTTALLKENRIDAAEKLLRHGSTVDYYLHYIQTDGQQKSTIVVLEQLRSSLLAMKQISTKTKIELADLKTLQEQTALLLKLI